MEFSVQKRIFCISFFKYYYFGHIYIVLVPLFSYLTKCRWLDTQTQGVAVVGGTVTWVTVRYSNWDKMRDIPTIKFSHYKEAIVVFGAPERLTVRALF
jgi:hypothetical protein